MSYFFRLLLLLLTITTLAACGNNQAEKPPYPGVKLGKPYEVYGRWYKPHYDPHYDEIGMASWYGPGFHGKRAANGETFDENELTGAHKTLPLPSIVRVTNLSNGRSALIKINDRGPFVADRIIDLSKASAKKLGIYGKGLAKVRVQFLENETKQYAQQHHIDTSLYANEIPQNEWHQETQEVVMPVAEVSPFAHSPYVVTAAPAQKVNAEPEASQPSPIIIPQNPPTSDPDIFSVVDNTQAQPQEPTPAAPVAVEQSQTLSSVSGGFYVQAGTFSVKANAQILTDKLLSSGNVQIKPMILNNQTLYRVVAGPYDSKENAKKLLSKLATLGISDAKITFD